MKVPFVDLKLQYQSIKEEIDEAIRNVISDSAFIGGKYLKSFEANFASFCEINHCVGVGNGTTAIYVALKSLGIGVGDEVITAANTFIATSEAITMIGARVVFVDCDPISYNIDVTKIEKKITYSTKAIVPVHLYGQSAHMNPILELAKKYNLRVINDAAQAHGAWYDSMPLSQLGDCTCYSFFPGKNLGAYGDAGAVVTNDEQLAQRIRMRANHGRKEKYNHEFEGINSRLDGLQAAILDVKLKHLDEWTDRRIKIADTYSSELATISNIIPPIELSDIKHVYHLYVIRVLNREVIKNLLAEKGIVTGIHYPIPLPYLKAYNYLRHTSGDFPVAYSLKDEILSLPIHGSMLDEQVEYVIEKLKESVKK